MSAQLCKVLADIKKEISWISGAAVVVAICSMSACSDLNTVAKELKRINTNDISDKVYYRIYD